MKWRLCEDGCPFRDEDECEIKPCTDWKFDEHGNVVQGEPVEGKFWCRSETCPLISTVRGVSRQELWNAYKDKKIRFGVDGQGNPTTTIMNEGLTVRSEQFTRELYDRALAQKPRTRDHTGRRLDRNWWRK